MLVICYKKWYNINYLERGIMIDRYRVDKFFRTLIKSSFKFTRTVKSEFIGINDFEKEEVYIFLKENSG